MTRHWDSNEPLTGSDVMSSMGSCPNPLTTTMCSSFSGCAGSLTGIAPNDIGTSHSLPCESNVTWCACRIVHSRARSCTSCIPRHDSTLRPFSRMTKSRASPMR